MFGFACLMLCRKGNKPNSFNMDNQVYCEASQAEASKFVLPGKLQDSWNFTFLQAKTTSTLF